MRSLAGGSACGRRNRPPLSGKPALAVAVLSLWVLCACVAPPSVKEPNSMQVLSLQMVGAYPVIHAQHDASAEPLRLVVDTAAGATVLDKAVAQRLGLGQDATAGTTVEGAAGATQGVQFAKPTTLRLGELAVAVTPLLTDMSKFSKGQVRYDGILGNDVLSRFDVQFSLPGQRLSLATPGSMPTWFKTGSCRANASSDRNAQLLNFMFVDAQAEAAAAQESRIALRAVVDTGAAQTVINGVAAQRMGLQQGDSRLRDRPGGTGGFGTSSVASQLTTLAGLGLGPWWAVSPEVRVSDLPVFKALGLEQQPAAILGIDLLQQVKLYVSAGAQFFCLETSN
jgi:Aspartyl protease